YQGIYANNAQGSHLYRNNVITKNSNDWFVYVTNTNDVMIDSNRFIGTGTNSSNRGIYLNNTAGNIKHNLIITPGRGIEITNQAGSSVQNNTLISINDGDYGMHITNLSTPSITNNIIQGYNKGIYAESTTPQYNNTPMGPNLFYDINSDLFSGDNLPVLIGSMVDENANGHISDIYGNIIDDPLFVHADTNNYNIQAGSPAVNAGVATINDPDGSVSDIGAYYYHIYVVMNHTALDNTDDITGPYRVNATLSSPAGATLTGSVHYAVDGGDYTALAMTAANNDTFYADIPGQALNTTIQYYISATDGEHTSTLPYNISSGGYSFFVSLFEQFANMNGSSNSDGDIELSWGTPVPISGTLTGLNLYKNTSPNVALTADNLYQEFAATATSYTDTETAEGITYYYKLTGTLDDGTEALVSAEVAVMSDDATKVRVVGLVQLSDVDTPDYSGVQVLFSKVSPAAISDSLETDESGEIDIVMQTGIYNIHFSKDGYQPYMIGNVFFSENVDLDTTIMNPGGSLVLDGEISGTLINSNVHFVDGDVTVPSGDTLVIQAGTLIKFRGDYSFTANGPVFAVGTADSHIVFTSGMSAPLEGDWKRIYLNNAPGSIFRYCDFSFAENGLLLNESDGTEISYCTFERHLSGAYAINDGSYDNSSSLTITYNSIGSGFTRGFDLKNAYNSEF
ncbi:MAG TPA: right-handed parallel beta-helix repeat-containing protein, partial [Arenicellales bacterium]|nr:right-handed parallel beta-helix repeat-containing protein [Arenicellales bacterium]